jgi:hypothetical protein
MWMTYSVLGGALVRRFGAGDRPDLRVAAGLGPLAIV